MLIDNEIAETAADCQQNCEKDPKCYFFVFNTEEQDNLNCMHHGIKAPQGNRTCDKCIRGPKYCPGKA